MQFVGSRAPSASVGRALDVLCALLGVEAGAEHFGVVEQRVDVVPFTAAPRRGITCGMRKTGMGAEMRLDLLLPEAAVDMPLHEACRCLLSALVERVPALVEAYGPGFDGDAFVGALRRVEAQLPADETAAHRLEQQLPRLAAQNEARYRIAVDEARRVIPRPLDRKVFDVRIYPVDRVGKMDEVLSLWAPVLSNAFHRAGVRAPGYQAVYVYTGETEEEARRASQKERLLRWARSTWAVVPRALLELDRREKERETLAAIRVGIERLAELDHLDPAALAKAWAMVEPDLLKTTLVYSSARNKKHEAVLKYRLGKHWRDEPAWWIDVTEVASGRSARIDLGRHNLIGTTYRLGRLELGPAEIRMHPRGKTSASDPNVRRFPIPDFD